MHTTTAAEWLQMVSLAAGVYAAASAPYFLLVDMEVWRWPRPLVGAVDRAKPLVWGVVRSGAVYPLWREWDNARHTVSEFGRDAAALVLLLTTSPKGALR